MSTVLGSILENLPETDMEVENHLFVVDFMVFLTGPGHPRNHVNSRECSSLVKHGGPARVLTLGVRHESWLVTDFLVELNHRFGISSRHDETITTPDSLGNWSCFFFQKKEWSLKFSDFHPYILD